MKNRMLIVTFLITATLAGKEKKPYGEVLDPQALGKVQSFCFDNSSLNPSELE